jgi:molybdopterin-guanine dinucleotide biosynthesis protein
MYFSVTSFFSLFSLFFDDLFSTSELVDMALALQRFDDSHIEFVLVLGFKLTSSSSLI